MSMFHIVVLIYVPLAVIYYILFMHFDLLKKMRDMKPKYRIATKIFYIAGVSLLAGIFTYMGFITR